MAQKAFDRTLEHGGILIALIKLEHIFLVANNPAPILYIYSQFFQKSLKLLQSLIGFVNKSPGLPVLHFEQLLAEILIFSGSVFLDGLGYHFQMSHRIIDIQTQTVALRGVRKIQLTMAIRHRGPVLHLNSMQHGVQHIDFRI